MRWHWAPKHFWKFEASVFKGLLDLKLLKSLWCPLISQLFVFLTRARLGQPQLNCLNADAGPKLTTFPQPANEQELRVCPRTGDTHDPLAPWEPSCAFDPAQARWQKAQVSSRQDNAARESHHCRIILTAIEGRVVKAGSGRRKKGLPGPVSWRRAGLQQAPRHRRSTAGSSVAFRPLWAYVPWQPDSDKSLPQVTMMETFQELRQQDA